MYIHMLYIYIIYIYIIYIIYIYIIYNMYFDIFIYILLYMIWMHHTQLIRHPTSSNASCKP